MTSLPLSSRLKPGRCSRTPTDSSLFLLAGVLTGCVREDSSTSPCDTQRTTAGGKPVREGDAINAGVAGGGGGGGVTTG